MEEKKPGRLGRWAAAFGAVFVALVGLILVVGGVQLVAAGGSPYYLLAGAGVLASGVLAFLRRPLAGWIYAATLAGTLVWALWEAGFRFWPLLPRLFAPAVLGLILLLVLLAARRPRRRALLATGGASALLLLVLAASLPGAWTQGQAPESRRRAAGAVPAQTAASDWRFYGRDSGGSRFTPAAQITRENVADLQLAWTFRTGHPNLRGSEDQNTPTQIGDTVYVCTPTNVVIALDADTGRQRWRFDPGVKPGFWNRCRGVGYHERALTPPVPVNAPAAAPTQPAAAPAAAPGLCARRIILSTIDARLIAMDAGTGAPCPGFGQGGTVDLKSGIGPFRPGQYFQTSTPTVAQGKVILGGWVADQSAVAPPSGVVRAFDVETGALAWAWDLGDSSITGLPPEGRTYSRGTPNVWSTPAFDESLGLIYLPTGNSTPDYWGSHRSAASEQYASSVVALDLATGRERWKFQTVHHDVWDYDVPSQPMLIDFPVGGGRTAPALLQLTKRGEVFVLDRATGRPLSRVAERPVPQGAQPGEWLSPTQPYSPDMPRLVPDRITERMMWGATPLDQMACRLTFRKIRYDGDFTPPGPPDRPALQFPGNGGGQNWGTAAWDPQRQLLLVPGVFMAQTVSLDRTDKPQFQITRAYDRPAQSRQAVAYESDNNPFVSPIFTPCIEPPNGVLAAVDLNTRKVVWRVPTGTAEKIGPFGLASGLRVPVGTVGLGGPSATAGGVTFHAATQDPYLRAYDSETGKLLWKARLPVGAGGTPMSYVSPKTGRQYVLLTAGGARLVPGKGDYVMAFALPQGGER
jgi:quinate dehydrogenase (quinone)